MFQEKATRTKSLFTSRAPCGHKYSIQSRHPRSQGKYKHKHRDQAVQQLGLFLEVRGTEHRKHRIVVEICNLVAPFEIRRR